MKILLQVQTYKLSNYQIYFRWLILICSNPANFEMLLIDVPYELWRKILMFMQEPSIDDTIVLDQSAYHQSVLNGLICSHSGGILREIQAKELYSLMLVSKQCYTLTMEYLWSQLVVTSPLEDKKKSHLVRNNFSCQNVIIDVLVQKSNNLYSSSLLFVRHYYVNSVSSLGIIDQPDTAINTFKLANPKYLPNLKTLTAKMNYDYEMDVGSSFIGTTYYPQQLSIKLTSDFYFLHELVNSVAQPSLLLITSLVFYFPRKTFECSNPKCLGLNPELHSVDPIDKMLNLKELTLVGDTISETYLDTVLSCRPILKILDLSHLSWTTPMNYKNIGNSVNELHCRDSGFKDIIDEKLKFPAVQKLSVTVNSLGWALDSFYESFTNLEEFVCDQQIGYCYDTVFSMCVNILQLNQGLKYFTLINYDSAFWHKAEDKMAFPSVLSVRLVRCVPEPKIKMLHSLFKIFPLCESIEITSSWYPVLIYQELKQFALTNRSSKSIIVTLKLNSVAEILQNDIMSDFCENEFSVSDFCFPLLPVPEHPSPQFLSYLGFQEKIFSFVIDVQMLQKKIAEFSGSEVFSHLPTNLGRFENRWNIISMPLCSKLLRERKMQVRWKERIIDSFILNSCRVQSFDVTANDFMLSFQN